MSAASWLQIIALIVVLGVTAYPLGIYMAKVYGDDEKAPGDRFFRPIDTRSTGSAASTRSASSAGRSTRTR